MFAHHELLDTMDALDFDLIMMSEEELHDFALGEPAQIEAILAVEAVFGHSDRQQADTVRRFRPVAERSDRRRMPLRSAA